MFTKKVPPPLLLGESAEWEVGPLFVPADLASANCLGGWVGIRINFTFKKRRFLEHFACIFENITTEH